MFIELLFILCYHYPPSQPHHLLLSVIIVNYNVKYFLDYCLYSVFRALPHGQGEVIVVDNHSSDDSRRFFEDKYPGARFIWNEENVGFARANNQALQQATGQYILFLNPDTLVGEDCFEKCISFIRAKGDEVACGVRMINGSGKFLKESKRAFPSPLTSLFKITGMSTLFSRSAVFARYHLGNLDPHQVHEIDVMAGAFTMVPKKILDQVGGFDERFFMYGEDIDLSYRIQKAGFRNFYFPEVTIVHFKGESTRKGSLNYVKLFYSAMSIFVRKHYREMKGGLFNILIRLAIWFRALLAACARILKWIGLPGIDAALILMSFWVIKFLWNRFVKQEVNYSTNLLLVAFPAFTLFFLLASYFSGLYDQGYRQSRLNKSVVTAIVTLLAAYSLLPEGLRFSRGILLFGSLLAFGWMSLARRWLLRAHIIKGGEPAGGIKQTLILGTEEELGEVSTLLHHGLVSERLLGRVGPGSEPEANTIGTARELSRILRDYPVRELICCQGKSTFSELIAVLSHIPPHIRVKFFIPQKPFMIGGGVVVEPADWQRSALNLHQAVKIRNKLLSDVLIALGFIATFPLHIFVKKRPWIFFRNVFWVLGRRRTWIGYALPEPGLPALKQGILTTTGLPVALNTLGESQLRESDREYARDFSIALDFRLVWLNYRMLS